jgi:hypothetical protein
MLSPPLEKPHQTEQQGSNRTGTSPTNRATCTSVQQPAKKQQQAVGPHNRAYTQHKYPTEIIKKSGQQNKAPA